MAASSRFPIDASRHVPALSVPPITGTGQRRNAIAPLLAGVAVLGQLSAGTQSFAQTNLHHELEQLQQERQQLVERTDVLDATVGGLESRAFGPTTTLKGEATFILGGVPGYGANGAPNSKGGGQTTLNDELRLNLYTSFTGKDLLREIGRAHV